MPTTAPQGPAHIVREFAMRVRLAGDGLEGRAEVVPEMHVPGTTCLRASLLAVWTDVLSGLLVGQVIAPRVPVTLELAVDLYRPATGCDVVLGQSRVLKAGRSVVVTAVDFTDGGGDRLAMGTCSFMAAPDATLTLPPIATSLGIHHTEIGRPTMPFAERAGCERTAPGVAELPRSPEGLNASNTINGGLIALTVEEATLSASPGATLASMAMRYLRPARVGPVVATASVHGDLGRVEVRDAGSEDRVAVVATTRVFRPSGADGSPAA